MIKHTLKSLPTKDSRLEPCPICGSDMLGRFIRNRFIFSCSNEGCILYRMNNNISIPVSYNSKTKHFLTEDEAIDMVNQRYK